MLRNAMVHLSAMYRHIFLLCMLFQASTGHAQVLGINQIALEYNRGRVVPSYSNFPDRSAAHSLNLKLFKTVTGNTESTSAYFNYPESGLSISFHDLGNTEVLGRQISVVPFIKLYPFSGNRSLGLFLGLGGVYNTSPYTVENQNRSLGSRFAWQFRTSIEWNIINLKQTSIYLNAGLDHSSNGHTVLPNAGLNKLFTGIGIRFSDREHIASILSTDYIRSGAKYHPSLFARTYLGFHELGGTNFPIGGPNHFIKGLDLGVIKNVSPGVRLLGVISARHYDSFQTDLEDNPDTALADSPFINSTAISLRAGAEFGLDRIYFRTELGVDVYKPYYDRFFALYDNGSSTIKSLRKYISGLYGLEFYLFRPDRQPSFNISIGGHVITNFAKADFTQISLTLHKSLIKTRL